jgi:hypothetical protein
MCLCYGRIFTSTTRKILDTHLSMQSVVRQNAAKYTKREVKEAVAARELMRKLGDPTPNDMCERLRLGNIRNTTVTPSDEWRSIVRCRRKSRKYLRRKQSR